MSDIRNFFGGKGGAPPPKKETPALKEDRNGNPNKRRNKSRMVVDDSDDDDFTEAKKTTPKKPQVVKKALKTESPKGEVTTSADYFASSKTKSSKPAAATAKSNPRSVSTPSAQNTPAKAKATPPTASGRSSTRKRTAHSYAEEDIEDNGTFLEDDEDDEDIFAADVKTNGRRKDDAYMEVDSDDEILPKSKTVIRKKAKTQDEDFDMNDVDAFVISDDEDVKTVRGKPTTKSAASSSRKRKSVELDDDEGLDNNNLKKAAKTKSPAKKPPAKKTKKEDTVENPDIQAIFDSIPTIEAPPPPEETGEKFDWRKTGGGNAGPPPGAGSKEIPEGAEECLAGLSFVFTGLLESISRDEAQALVKRYGGKITGAPSSKTSYVVLGSDAGPSKLKKIQAMKIKTINEDGLFELIRKLPANGGSGLAASKVQEKKKADEEKVKKQAEEMEAEERRRAAEEIKEAQRIAAARGASAPTNVKPKTDLNSQLWTSKYAPSQINQICGNKAQVEKIQRWLKAWPRSHKMNFQLPGPDGSGGSRAIIISGPPGIGKTTAAHLAAKLEGYDVIESNASDTRSKKLVETGLSDIFNNKSLLGFFAGDGKQVDIKKQKVVLIMDEVDGMSAGDRGGVGALAKVCKKTDVPIILICNERSIPKMKPFDHVAYDMKFIRPTVDMIRSRVATICHREGLKLDKQAMDALIEGSNRDIRQIVNMLSTARLAQTAMDFDTSKSMSKNWEKHIILKPWDICHKLLGSGLFAPSSKATLNEKIELYFNDHEMSYLMLQENYLSTKPLLATSQNLPPKQMRLKVLDLVDQAAESISDGDLVDRMIHGSQQQWSLMPTHGVFSTVRPASFMSGAMTDRTAFTSWLGNNSKATKLMRYVKEIQSHMRLRTSGDRHEIRQQYLPVLWEKMIRRLAEEGKDAVSEVIDLMDSYFLTKDDFDFMLELGLGSQAQETVKIESQAKATFTRLYNQASHPMPFMKASAVGAAPKIAKEVHDLEEAIEEDDDMEEVVEPKADEENEEEAIKKDKYIKAPKKKAATKKAKATKNEDEMMADSEEDEKPKKGRGKGKGAATKSKAKK